MIEPLGQIDSGLCGRLSGREWRGRKKTQWGEDEKLEEPSCENHQGSVSSCTANFTTCFDASSVVLVGRDSSRRLIVIISSFQKSKKPS
jgi:hypothetical protein